MAALPPLMNRDRLIVVLDACVLAPMPVADTLLRLAEESAFYQPRWSPEILAELKRTLIVRFRYAEVQAQRRLDAMTAAFPEACVDGYQDLVLEMKNDPKDRHVLAAAIQCGAHAIVSDNRKHFPRETLAPYGLECMSADQFLERQYRFDPGAFINTLVRQAQAIGWTLPQLLAKHAPSLHRNIITKL